MIELEKLYESARVHLGGQGQDWIAFAADFEVIFHSKFVLYRPTLANGVLAWRSLDDLVTTTNPELAKDYIKNRVFDSNKIHDDSLNPLEPSRRSDVMSNDEFRIIDVAKNFFMPNGIFYMLAVSAILVNDSYLMLVVWRNEAQGDFSDIEMQRLALFMRYLAVLVGGGAPASIPAPDQEVKSFGEKYALTDTEINILSAMLQGHSLRIIAEESGRAYGTVRWHVQNILEKCQVKTQKNLLNEFYRLIKR